MESPNEEFKLLIVDDSPDNQSSFEGILNNPELEITWAASGEQALQILLQQP